AMAHPGGGTGTLDGELPVPRSERHLAGAEPVGVGTGTARADARCRAAHGRRGRRAAGAGRAARALTGYPELDAVLGDLVAGARISLGDTFCGAYLHGSFAIGDA